MPGFLYLAESPFVVSDTDKNHYKYLSQTTRITDFEREDEALVRNAIWNFINAHGLVRKKGEQIEQESGKNTGSWKWMVSWRNFRNLVDESQYQTMLNILDSMEGEPLEEILDLHTRISTLVDVQLLNTLAHRVITSISRIPYPVAEGIPVRSWEAIHTESPFVWLIILMQTIIRNEATA